MNWQVEIVQNNKILIMQNGEFDLTKKPFRIIVRIPHPLTVKLNVFDTDTNFQRVYPGFNLDLKKNGYSIHPFVKGMGFAEDYFNKDEILILEDTGHHYLFYSNEQQHRWSKADISTTGTIFERKVSKILINKETVPIEKISKSKLYFTFLVKLGEDDIISSNELLKLILESTPKSQAR